ncbi:hypothetical protein [Bacillus sp. NPDC094106]|uniref:hypothetical protein n=1 Tax=Bacillus sp. NPDC094106 TaxID=3363949 RepID=UPI00382FA1C2
MYPQFYRYHPNPYIPYSNISENYYRQDRQALWWNSEIRHLSEALANIGELKFVISNELKKMGFSDVGISRLDVSGNKPGCRVSIAHFYKTGREFWEVVMCVCKDTETAQRTVQEVVTTLRNLKFL